MNYMRIYKKIISSRIGNSPEGYFEKHHIIPRALGGADEAENIVKLTAREHFIAHCLLARIHGGTMWVAILRMKGRLFGEKYVNSRLYESAKIRWSKWLSENQLGDKNHNFGKALTEDHKRKLSLSGSFRKLTEEHKQNISKAHKGRVFSAESREKMSAAKKGKINGANNPMFGKKRPDLVLRNKSRALEKRILSNSCVETAK